MKKNDYLLGFRSVLYSTFAVFSYLYIAYSVMSFIFTEKVDSIFMVVLCTIYVVAYSLWDHTGDVIRYVRVKVKEGINGK